LGECHYSQLPEHKGIWNGICDGIRLEILTRHREEFRSCG